MTALKPYPEYKGSGVEWVDKIPREWATHKLGNLFDLQRRPVSPDDEIVTAFRDGQVTLRSKRRVEGFTEADKEIGYQGIRAGDLVIHNMDAFAGAIGVSDSNGKSTPVYSAATPRQGHDAAYFAYLLRHLALTSFITALARGIRERSSDFRWASAREVLVPVPSREEQRSIASFVARETAEIDAFVADQEELIGLLTERRAATISHAVTKGLDSSVPMKESGIAGVGYIPASWTTTRFKNLGTIRYGIGEPPGYVDNGVPLIRATNVSEGRIRVDRMALVDPNDIPAGRIHWLAEGDIIVVRSGALTGDSAIIPRQYKGAIAGFDMVFRANPNVSSMFVQYALLASYLKKAQLEVASARAAQPHLNAQELGDARVVLAPFNEQKRIVDSISREITELDAALADAREAIALSRERRAALISAAVTGKIDVREHAHSGVA